MFLVCVCAHVACLIAFTFPVFPHTLLSVPAVCGGGVCQCRLPHLRARPPSCGSLVQHASPRMLHRAALLQV